MSQLLKTFAIFVSAGWSVRLLTILANPAIVVVVVLTILLFLFWLKHYLVGLGVFIASRVLRRPFDELMLLIAPYFSHWRKRYGVVRKRIRKQTTIKMGRCDP